MTSTPHSDGGGSDAASPRRSSPSQSVSFVEVRNTAGPALGWHQLVVLEEARGICRYFRHLAHRIHAWTQMPLVEAGDPAAEAQPLDRERETISTIQSADRLPDGGAGGECERLAALQAVFENTLRLVTVCQTQLLDAVRARHHGLAVSVPVTCGESTSNAQSDGGTRSSEERSGGSDPAEITFALLDEVLLETSVQSSSDPSTASDPLLYAAPSSHPLVECAGRTEPKFGRPRRSPWPATEACYVFHVEFKSKRVRRFRSPELFRTGTHVIVPGDGGYDIGLIAQTALWNPYTRCLDPETITALGEVDGSPGRFDSILDVFRPATEDEVSRLYGPHSEAEAEAATVCNNLAASLNLPMCINECEIQFDCTKFTFFFVSSVPVDFRRLISTLHQRYNARIWMQNTNTAVQNKAPSTAVPRHKQEGFQCNFRGFVRH